MTARRMALALALALAGCKGGAESAPAPLGPTGESMVRFGPLMLQIGHRLEQSGRAARAGRWELAAYEAQELREVYEGPLREAPAPPEIHARIEPFIDSCLRPLEDAARAQDMTRFEREFETTTTGCNACHASAGVAFIEIPNAPGEEIPRTAPVTPPTDAP
jgi:hypothetical protein